jgi:signal transduction histidine kinase
VSSSRTDTVTDDGPGFDPATATMGAGLEHMADRLGAVGGAVSWESEPGRGTRIVGSVPLATGGRDTRSTDAHL